MTPINSVNTNLFDHHPGFHAIAGPIRVADIRFYIQCRLIAVKTIDQFFVTLQDEVAPYFTGAG